MSEELDRFGEFFIRNLRDKMLNDLEMLLQGSWKAPGLQKLQRKLCQLDAAEKELLRELADRLVITGMHDFLFALQEQFDADGSIRVLVDGEDVAKISDGLHGEIFGEEGWITRFSKFPSKQ